MRHNTYPVAFIILIQSLYLALPFTAQAQQQGWFVNGARVQIENNAVLYVNGSYQTNINSPSGSTANKGEIWLTGNWINLQPNPAIVDTGGIIRLSGNASQTIDDQLSMFSHIDASAGSNGSIVMQKDVQLNGTLTLGNRTWRLNQHTLTVENDDTLAISGSKIVSENFNSRIKWKISANEAVYKLPFSTSQGLPVSTALAMQPGEAGYIIAATQAATDNNTPLPPNITNFNLDAIPLADKAIDRFWQIDIGDRTANTTFQYTTADITGNLGITPTTLTPIRWNSQQSNWEEGYSSQYIATQNAVIGFGLGSGVYSLYSRTATSLYLKLMLQGAYISATGLMRTDLQSLGVLSLTQPFGQAPWSYNGTEHFVSWQNVPQNATDWCLIELRDINNPMDIVAQRAALLLNNGNVYDVNGQNGVLFPNLPHGNYYIVLRTRNHLATLSALPKSLPNTAATLYDFTQAGETSGGADGIFPQMAIVGNNVAAQRAGDINADGVITVTDYNLYVAQSSLINQYMPADVSLDGSVTVSDYNLYLPNSSAIGNYLIRY